MNPHQKKHLELARNRRASGDLDETSEVLLHLYEREVTNVNLHALEILGALNEIGLQKEKVAKLENELKTLRARESEQLEAWSELERVCPWYSEMDAKAPMADYIERLGKERKK